MTCTNFSRSLPGSLLANSRTGRVPQKIAAALVITAIAPAALLAFAHTIPEFGSWAADSLRSVVGTDQVARLEDTVYSVRDSVNQITKAGEQPRSYWITPSQTNDPPTHINDENSRPEKPVHSFEPAQVKIPFPSVKAPGDGVWINVRPGENSLKKTLLHPDPERTWAELFVVAIDLHQLSLEWVPGLHEPENISPKAEDYQRTGRIPSDANAWLVAAFNGGFKTQHGKFGAQIAGVTLVPPREHLCTLIQTQNGQLLLGTYEHVNSDQEYRWLRQTPACMIEKGQIHPGLTHEHTKNWGATLDGDTVIRRSAIGLSSDRSILYMGISNDTTARALALGMQSAGADTVAQLDVNQSYPKFVHFEAHPENLQPRPLVEGFAIRKDQYLKPEGRDFFYLTSQH